MGWRDEPEIWEDVDLDGIPDGPVKRFIWNALKYTLLTILVVLLVVTVVSFLGGLLVSRLLKFE